MTMTRPPETSFLGGGDRDLEGELAKELSQLSVEERELAYEEIHGVDDVIEETPEFVGECLEKMERHLGDIRRKHAYDLALKLNKSYVQDRKLRLMFLRADHFDAKLAASRFVKFLDGKLEIFGEEILTRTIRMNDLNEIDMKALKQGATGILPVRDRGGRAVFYQFRPFTNGVHQEIPNMVCRCNEA